MSQSFTGFIKSMKKWIKYIKFYALGIIWASFNLKKIEKNQVIFSVYGWLSLKYATEEANFSAHVKTNSTVE